ncbi:MAG: BCCT family transporter [Planctomycetota bacterium]
MNSDSNESKSPTPQLNHWVFWPPFLLLIGAIALNFISPDRTGENGEKIQGWFSVAMESGQSWILGNFGWLFTLVATSSLILTLLISCSKFRNVRLGGPDAKPLMSMWNWFSITICTTIAIGILFWSTAEPISHMMSPPDFAGAQPGSNKAATFALSTMYLHWSFTPYAIYCVASLMFGYAYYNLKQPYSLGSTLTPLFGDKVYGRGGTIIDAICLYALVAGMAAALGTGILMLGGGLQLLTSNNDTFKIVSGKWVWLGITLLIVSTFIVSSATGLMKGIRILSDINTKLLFVLALVPVFFGASWALAGYAGSALVDYVVHFVPRHFDFSSGAWEQDWTVFYWAVWLAWAPVTACFLGRIAYGRTVGEFLLVNFLFPALFAIVWMTIFSGTAIDMQLRFIDNPDQPLATNLHQVYVNDGEESVSYAVFSELPLKLVLIIFYMVSAFVCFVTSSDSNMSAMSSISSTGITPENPEGNLTLKIIWGVTVGAVAWIMISFTGGVKGVKMLSNLGGFPAAFLQLLIIAALAKVVWTHQFPGKPKAN